MMGVLLLVVTFVALLGSGLMAGVFFAFSTFVMRALSRLDAGAGIAAMQSINVAVINPAFLGVFLGTAAACVGSVVGAAAHWGKPGGAYVIAGGALYLIGTFVVTVRLNVPLNAALARVSPADADAAARWADYVRRWTAWNHVRAAAAVVACGSFALALARVSRDNI